MQSQTTIPRGRRVLILSAIAVLCIGLDQSTKQLAAQHLSPLLSTLYLDGLVRLIYAQNSGMFSSLGVGLSAAAKFWLFTVGVGALLLSLLGSVLIARRVGMAIVVGVALVLGGGLSNLLDRLLHQGLVTDFIYLVIGDWITDIFNLADLFIGVGVIILVWAWLRRSCTD